MSRVDSSDPIQWISRIPLVTKSLLIVNISIHALIFLFSIDIGLFAISARQVIYQYEIYRIASAAFVHIGVMHIFFNMSSLLQLGSQLENQFGSMSFLLFSTWAVFAVGSLYCLLAW